MFAANLAANNISRASSLRFDQGSWWPRELALDQRQFALSDMPWQTREINFGVRAEHLAAIEQMHRLQHAPPFNFENYPTTTGRKKSGAFEMQINICAHTP